MKLAYSTNDRDKKKAMPTKFEQTNTTISIFTGKVSNFMHTENKVRPGVEPQTSGCTVTAPTSRPSGSEPGSWLESITKQVKFHAAM